MGFDRYGFYDHPCLVQCSIGHTVDKWVRKNIIAAGVAIWSVEVIAYGPCSELRTLATRAAVGIGEASYAPAAHPHCENFPVEKRARASL